MPQDVVFHQGLHCLLRQNPSSEKEVQYFHEIITCYPLLYTIGHPDFSVCSIMENSIGLKLICLHFHSKIHLFKCSCHYVIRDDITNQSLMM